MRQHGTIGYAARAMRGYFATNLPVGPTVQHDFRLDLTSGLLYGVFNGSAVGYIYVVARTIGVSQTGISLLMAMAAVGAILSLPVSMIPRGGNGGRTLMFGAWTAGRASVLLLLLFSSPGPYMIIASLFLISSSIATPFYAEVLQAIYPREFRGRLMSLVRIGGGSVTTLASLGTAWLLGVRHAPFQTVFAGAAVMALLSVYAFARVTPVRPPPRPRPPLRDTFGILRRNSGFAGYQLWVFFMGSGNIMSATLYPLVIVDKMHAGYGPFGVLSVITALGYLMSFFVWGRVVDRKGPLFTMLVVGICIITMPVGLLVAPSAYWLLPFMFVNGIANAGFEIGPFAAVIHFSASAPRDVPRYMALHSILSGTRGLIFPFVATLVLASHQYSRTLTVAVAISAIGTFMLWRLARQEARGGPTQIDQASAEVPAAYATTSAEAGTAGTASPVQPACANGTSGSTAVSRNGV